MAEEPRKKRRKVATPTPSANETVTFTIINGVTGARIVAARTMPEAVDALFRTLPADAHFKIVVNNGTSSAMLVMLTPPSTMTLIEEPLEPGDHHALPEIEFKIDMPPFSKQKWLMELCEQARKRSADAPKSLMVQMDMEIADVQCADGAVLQAPNFMSHVVQCKYCKTLCASRGAALHHLWFSEDPYELPALRCRTDRYDVHGEALAFTDLIKEAQWSCSTCTEKQGLATYLFSCARCLKSFFDVDLAHEDTNCRPQVTEEDDAGTWQAEGKCMIWCSHCSEQYSGNFTGA